MKTSLLIPAFLFVLILSFVNATEAPLSFQNQWRPETLRSVTAPGRLVVKYKDSVTACVHCALQKEQPLSSASSDRSDSLDELHRRFQVKAATPLFRSEDEVTGLGPSSSSLQQQEKRRFDVIKARFANRTKRIPGDASLPALHHIYVLQIPKSIDVEAAATEFRLNPDVEYAHPDYLVTVDLVPNDPFFKSHGSWRQRYDDLWALKADKVNLPPAWDITQGEGIVVGVVDSGVDYTHPDIAANIWTNAAEIPNNQKDDDRNGFVDDTRGWDFVTCIEFGVDGCLKSQTPDNNPFDDHFHGTHVAGTIAAVGNNKRGIIGVAPRSQIMMMKSFNSQGTAPLSEAAAGIVYAAANGADIINNSWGCGFCPVVPVSEDAVKLAHGLGAVVVFAAGNSDAEVRIRSPQNMHQPKPIVAAASNQDDQPTFFTSLGATVDVAAPGGGKLGGDNNILSLKTKKCKRCSFQFIVDKQYLRLQGTSMAAPHVSGLAALILAQRPDFTNDDIRQVLKASAEDISIPGFDLRSGAGRIHAPSALNMEKPLQVKIAAPQHLSTTKLSSIAIRGTAAGPDFDQYQLHYSIDDGAEWEPLGGPVDTSVQNGQLGVFPVRSLPFGWKLLKLTATTQDGFRYEDVINVGTQLQATEITSRSQIDSFNDVDVSSDLVVWAGDHKKGSELESRIYVYDLKSADLRLLSDMRFVAPNPRVSGNLIVWTNSSLGQSKDTLYACYYNRTNGDCPIQTIADGGVIARHSLSDDRIVWNSMNGVHVYDLKTQTGRKIFERPASPDISGDLVVYTDILADDIIVHDLRTDAQRKIAKGPGRERNAQISGRTVVFVRRHDQKDDSILQDLVSYDLDTEEEKLLVRGFPGVVRSNVSQFSDGRFVWANLGDIYMYDLATGTLHAIAIDPIVPRVTPVISEDRVFWLHLRDFILETGDIFTARIPKR